MFLKNILVVNLIIQESTLLQENNKLNHFNLNIENLTKVKNFVIKVTETNYPNLKIPQHSRIRHFESFDDNFINNFFSLCKCTRKEKFRRLIDLSVISVLLDAGAGNKWSYFYNNKKYTRSEGLALASYEMFKEGLFSSDVA